MTDLIREIGWGIMAVIYGLSYLSSLRAERGELGEQPTLLDNVADYSLPCAAFGIGAFFIVLRLARTVEPDLVFYIMAGIVANLLGTVLVYHSRALWNKKSPRAQRLKARQEARKTVLDSSTQTSLTSTPTAPMTVTSQQSAGGMQSVGRRP